MIAYPVIAAHGVEAICATYEDQIIVSGDEHFDEIVTFILRGKSDEENITHYQSHEPRAFFFKSMRVKGNEPLRNLLYAFLSRRMSLCPLGPISMLISVILMMGKKKINTHFSISSLSFMSS